MVPFNITRAAHAELKVTDLMAARAFYIDALGFHEVYSDSQCLYLGGFEELDKYSLILRKDKSPGLNHLSFRVANQQDLELIEKVYREAELPTRWIEANTLENGQGRALRAQDPSGLPVEFFHQIEQRPWLRQKFELFRGANIMRIDHFNCQIPDVQKGFDWWTKKMGFYLSEAFVTDGSPKHLWASWLHRKQNVHDLALMCGTGPRLHHVGFWVQDTSSILKACDILASLGMRDKLERGPGRHGISNAFFLYIRDPDGNRIELYTNDYIIPDPDFKPVLWNLSDPAGRTFWGHQAPKSWFEEASLVEDIKDGRWMPARQAKEDHRPEFVT